MLAIAYPPDPECRPMLERSNVMAADAVWKPHSANVPSKHAVRHPKNFMLYILRYSWFASEYTKLGSLRAGRWRMLVSEQRRTASDAICCSEGHQCLNTSMRK